MPTKDIDQAPGTWATTQKAITEVAVRSEDPWLRSRLDPADLQIIALRRRQLVSD